MSSIDTPQCPTTDQPMADNDATKDTYTALPPIPGKYDPPPVPGKYDPGSIEVRRAYNTRAA